MVSLNPQSVTPAIAGYFAWGCFRLFCRTAPIASGPIPDLIPLWAVMRGPGAKLVVLGAVVMLVAAGCGTLIPDYQRPAAPVAVTYPAEGMPGIVDGEANLRNGNRYFQIRRAIL